MRKYLIFLTFFAVNNLLIAQCELPEPFDGNTGSNMTVMLTPPFISSLPEPSESAYIVALTESGMVVGSVEIYGVSQTSLAVWGDDTDTPETDGAVFGESILLKMVDGSSLYNLTAPTSISYSTNAMSVQGSGANPDLCEVDNTDVQDGNCDFPGLYTGNTGSNMTLMLTSGFFSGITSITSEDAYISATSNGMLVGSVPVYGLDQTSLAVWGDDSSTPDVIDGAEIGASISLELVDGSSLYSINAVAIPYVVNGTQIISSATSVLTCGTVEILGCTDPVADNFLISANTDDSSCLYGGCTDLSADNYDINANLNDGSCIWEGCTSISACNYNAIANDDDGSCFYNEPGYDCSGICVNDSDGDGVCDEFEVSGCIDSNGCNYNASATDSASCTYPIQEWLDCNGNCNFDSDNDGICDEFEQSGCTNPTAYNYNPSATDDDGSCESVILGCTNPNAANFDSSANTDNGLCQILGCTDSEAFNFNSEANFNDGSCIDVIEGCTDPSAANYDPSANTDNFSCIEMIYGCTDPAAINTDDIANTDDGSCEYVSFNGAWPSDPNGLPVTGNNATIAILGGIDLDNGDLVGAFYEANNEIVCGGLLIWDATASEQLIVVWGDDANDPGSNGFAPGEEIVWMLYDQSTGETTNLYPLYSLGNNNYMVNAAYVIDGWIIDPLYGCMDLAYQNYDANALVDDGTCSVLWSDLYADQAVVLADALVNIDELDTEILNLENTLATTISDYLGQLQAMELDYEGQLFNQYQWLTDSLNLIHYQWDVAVDNLVSDSIALEAYIDILQSDSTSLEAYIDDLQSDSVALADDIAGLEDYITGLESHISSLLSDSLDLEIHVYNLQLDSASFEVTIDGLQGDIVNLNNEVAGLLDDFSDLEFNLAETITDYNNQISNLNNAHDAEVEAINLAHANLVSGIEEDALNAANAAADLLAFTIDSASVAFAQDESADEALLAQTIQDFENQIDVLNNNDAAEDYEYESIIDALQADSLDLENHIYNLQQDSLSFESTIDGLEDEILNLNANINDLSSDLAYHSAPIEIDLVYGWNMIGFSLQEPMDAPASLEILGSDLHLIKNNSAQVYWPEFGFNSLGILVPGQGYQIRMYNAYDNFTFPYIPGVRLEVQPDVPAWVQEMELPLHPNDVRSLVRVVNTIGQEVNPEDVFDGEVLIYLYSDGTVEKAIK